mgnify:CR=1 FL=1
MHQVVRIISFKYVDTRSDEKGVCSYFTKILQNNDKFTFLILGKWEKRKSTKELVKAFAELFGDNDKIELLLSCSNNFPDDGHKSTEERLKEINVNCKNIKIISTPWLTFHKLYCLFPSTKFSGETSLCTHAYYLVPSFLVKLQYVLLSIT